MNMNLRLVCACAHDPVAIFTDPDAVTSLFELEILQKLDTILVFGIVLQTSLSASRKPVGQRSGTRCARNCVYGNGSRI